jgi:hypothetical protein
MGNKTQPNNLPIYLDIPGDFAMYGMWHLRYNPLRCGDIPHNLVLPYPALPRLGPTA